MRPTLLAVAVLLSGCVSVRRASCYVTQIGSSPYVPRVHLCKGLVTLDYYLTLCSAHPERCK